MLVAGLIGASLSAVAHAEDLLDWSSNAVRCALAWKVRSPRSTRRPPQGELVGFDVDIAKAVAAKLGVKPEFVTTEWSGIIAGLQADKFDVIVNQVGITDARKQTLDFSPPTRIRTRN